MAVSRIKAVFACDVRTLWDTVTSLENYSWRGDISRIEILSEKQFAEFTKNGYKTVFTITAEEPCKRWEFDLENDNIKGHWTGLFAPKEDGAELDFTENVSVKRVFMRPFVRPYLKKQQARYAADLKKAVEMDAGRKDKDARRGKNHRQFD